MPTTHHGYTTLTQGQSDWVTDLNTALNEIDVDTVITGTRAEREAYTTPQLGLVWLETDQLAGSPFWYHDGAAWQQIGTANANTSAANTWTANQTFNDDVFIILGTDGDFGIEYDAIENQLRIVASPTGASPSEVFAINPTGEIFNSAGAQLADRTWVDTTADVPNADHADNADALGGTAAAAYLTEAEGDAAYYSAGEAANFSRVSVGGNTIAQSVAASGQVTLSGGTATVATTISAVDATFMLALGIDDPAANAKIAGSLFWDDTAGVYKVEINETTTNVGTPTVNYDVIRVR